MLFWQSIMMSIWNRNWTITRFNDANISLISCWGSITPQEWRSNKLNCIFIGYSHCKKDIKCEYIHCFNYFLFIIYTGKFLGDLQVNTWTIVYICRWWMGPNFSKKWSKNISINNIPLREMNLAEHWKYRILQAVSYMCRQLLVCPYNCLHIYM